MKVNLFFAWFDLWVGVFIDRKRKRLYILPVPCLGLLIRWGTAPEGEGE